MISVFRKLILALLLFYIAVLAQDSAGPVRPTVAVLGTGDMGDSFGPRLAALGYRVIYGSRTPRSERVTKLIDKTGHGASAETYPIAAKSADVVLLAIAERAVESIVKSLGPLDGKIVIDLTYPPTKVLDDGYEEISIPDSRAEQIQAWRPMSRVVKAFGTTASNVIDNPEVAGGPVTIPIASDHRDAKETVARIAAELGLDPVDAGPLRHARYLEAMMLLYIVPHVQERDTRWEFSFRRSTYWVCNSYTGGEWDDWDGPPPVDIDNVAVFPNIHGDPKPCP